MSTVGAAFKLGVWLLGIGLLVSLLAPSLGLLLGQLGMLVIGGTVILQVLAVGLVAVLVAAEAESGSTSSDRGRAQRRRRAHGHSRARDVQPGPKRPGTNSSETATPDLDVEAIDDYER